MSAPVRKCPRCREEKPIADFGMRMKRGKLCPLPYCRSCHIAYHKEWRNTPHGKEKFARSENARKNRYPDRLAARKMSHAAIRAGRLVPGQCVVGGDCSGIMEGHHDDYSKPLEVRWVCRKHHRILDRERRSAA